MTNPKRAPADVAQETTMHDPQPITDAGITDDKPAPTRYTTVPVPPTRVVLDLTACRASERYLNPATGIRGRSVDGVARQVAERMREAFADPEIPHVGVRLWYMPHVAGDDHEAVERVVQAVGKASHEVEAKRAVGPMAPQTPFSRTRRRTRSMRR